MAFITVEWECTCLPLGHVLHSGTSNMQAEPWCFASDYGTGIGLCACWADTMIGSYLTPYVQ
jgi:hypothetical protein